MSVVIASWQEPTETTGGGVPEGADAFVCRTLHSVWVRKASPGEDVHRACVPCHSQPVYQLI